MAGSMDSLVGPAYISSRSADLILSDVRPIKLKLEALRAINVLLDEFLYNVLNAAGSISTDKLKSGLIKILPTSLGKEAVLEAELELRAYRERSPPSSPISPQRDSADERDNGDDDGFDLQWSYEVLRLKCEAFSNMNECDDNTEAENLVHERMATDGDRYPPKSSQLAPASLYLTAILERTLSKVSRVAARDSSRTVATVQDLFVALCEDHAIYGTFRSMKVYEQFEALSKSQKERRSKSISGSTDRASPAPRASSIADTRESLSKLRISTDSVTAKPVPLVSASSGTPRNTSDMPRAAKMFRRSSDESTGDRPESLPGEISRVQTSGSQNGSLPDTMVAGDSSTTLFDDFDELMRSGTTMKVSLTPDRLRTMEVYKQEKKQRHKQNQVPSLKPSDLKRGPSQRKSSLHDVEAIVEDDEGYSPPQTAPPSSTSTFQTSNTSPRPRQTSLTNTTAVNSASARARSASVSAAGQKKKTEMPPPPLPSSINSQRPFQFPPSQPNMMDGRPPRTRRVAHKRESMDLDEVMGGSDDELDPFPPIPKSSIKSTKPSSKPGTPNTVPTGKPYISKAAKELIDFLDEGPPEMDRLPTNPSMISFESGRNKSGRFQRMFSRLTIGGSRENLNGSHGLENGGFRGGRLGSRMKRTSSTAVAPPVYVQSSLSSKRSMPNVIIATPPRPPPPPRPPSPPSSSHASTEDVTPSITASRRLSVARKAVPTFENHSQTPPVPRVPVDESDIKPPPRSSSSSAVLRPVNGNGHTKSASAKEFLDHRKDVFHKVDPAPPSISSDRALASENASPTTTNTSYPVINGTGVRRPIPRVSVAEKEATTAPKQPIVKEHKETATSEAFVSISDMVDMRRLLSAATTADECRLIVDMFLAKNRVVPASKITTLDTPPPSPDALVADLKAKNDELERSLVGALLGDDGGM